MAGSFPDGVQDLRQARSAEVRHANRADDSGDIFVDRVDRDDIRVLQLRQCLRFAAAEVGGLQRNAAVGEFGLLGQKDSRERPLAELLAQPISKQLIADFG